ncbi:MAG: imidazole glycerol phosphate synthase subunit HisH [Caulobacteraceae bacterium]
MQTVALIDYGSGNLRSAEKALLKAASGLSREMTIAVTHDPAVIAAADRVVLPGVGAFAACMGRLKSYDGLIGALTEAVRGRAVPFLGVCVGMQLLATRGLEFGETPGLGWISGDVRKIEPKDPALKVPHMGWNSLDGTSDQALFAGLPDGSHMYFTHSFALYAEDAADVAAWTTHGEPLCAAVTRGNVAGSQFHPEKSQASGQRFLANFLEWAP